MIQTFCLIILIGLCACQNSEECVFYVHIYESSGEKVTTLGPFNNEDVATDEASDYMRYRGGDNYSYKVELNTKSGCKEVEE